MIRSLRTYAFGSLLSSAAILAAGTASAQQPLSVGTASALGGTAVTEARRADAILWNPALVGIYEGPRSSYSFLSVDFSRVSGAKWLEESGEFGLLGNVDALGKYDFTRAVLPPDADHPGARLGVTWAAFQADGFALSVSTHANAGARLPSPFVEGDEPWAVDPAVETAETYRSTASVFGLSKAGFFGPLPLLGPVWLGATAKGWLLHSFAQGEFARGRVYGADVYRETVLQNVPGYGVDLGIALRPFSALRLGASASNLYSGMMRPERGPRIRSLSLRSAADGSVVIEQAYTSNIDAGDEGTPEYRLAESLWRETSFPAVLRAGAALDFPVGTVAGSVTHPLRAGGIEPAEEESRYHVSVRARKGLPLRLMAGYGADVREYGAGVEFGRCDRRWTLGVARRESVEFGTAYSLSGSVTFQDLFCLQPR